MTYRVSACTEKTQRLLPNCIPSNRRRRRRWGGEGKCFGGDGEVAGEEKQKTKPHQVLGV